MKVLQLCKKFPYPLRDGESIAVNSLSKPFQELGCEVTLLAMNTAKHYCDVHQLPAHFNHYAAIHTVPVDNRLKLRDAFVNLFCQKSYHITRFESDAFAQKLLQLLQATQFDIIQLETVYLAPYIPLIRRHTDALIAMRAHNVEHEIWERITENTWFWPKKWYLRHLTEKLRRYEIAQLANYDLLVAISERDLSVCRRLGYQGAAVVTPIGINSNDYQPQRRISEDIASIGFIGSLDWMPNQEGLQWFLDKVWPHLHRRFPTLTFHIAGRNTPAWIERLQVPKVIVHGEVPDAAAFINQHPVMVTPLLSGSGMRVKILESMALGRTVVTTSLGLEGIQARHRQEVLMADTPAAFVQAIIECCQNTHQTEQIGQRARAFVLETYDNREIALHLLQTYSRLYQERFGVTPYLPAWSSGALSPTRA
ncbi:MAG TPA: glycosyltransferase family 4 protein [Saprospiraceae bacterium]|nr:glycosyltransferase family 4 protein [Saprospiraceae bacterium]HMP26206.1 glycosyltransferase family 4 protein [Saprospiraceae bacterium]